MTLRSRLVAGFFGTVIAVGTSGVVALNVTAAGARVAQRSVSPPAPPFNQCPAVGADASCETLIVVNADGTVDVYGDPSQGPYDSSEDALIGIENDSSATVTHLTLTGTTQPFGFDGDGVCTYLPAGSCNSNTIDDTGYGGPLSYFTNIDTSTYNTGDVNFIGGLAPNAHTFFSLEGDVMAQTITPPTTITTVLTGGGSSGGAISVSPGTAVTDAATLAGTNVATATGTVTYTVYSDSSCTSAVSTGNNPNTKSVTNGSVPDSDPVTLTAIGTYYWQASYSGDTNNGPSTSNCGDETETVGTAPHDGRPPVCVLLKVKNGPPESLTVDIEDNRSGIASIAVVSTTNATVKVPVFTPGTRDRNLVRLFKTDQTKGSAVRLSATDVAGNSHDCSFVFFVVNGKSKQSMAGVDPVDSTIDVVNYSLPNLTYSVDGAGQLVTLTPNQNKFIHAGRLFTNASNNHVTVTGHCTGLADVVFFDGGLPGNPQRNAAARAKPAAQPNWCQG